MAKTQLVVSISGTGSTFSADNYQPISGRVANTISLETSAQIAIRQAGTISNLSVNVSANTATTCDFYVRQNTANSAIVVSYTSGQTGIKEDTTNSITVSAGDLINYFSDLTAGVSIVVNYLTCVFDSSGDTYQIFCTNNSAVSQNDNLTQYYMFSDTSVQSTEANAQCEMLTSGTFKHLFVNVTANTITANSDFYLSKNASTTSCPTVQYTSLQTGVKEDTSTSIASADGDLCNFKLITASQPGTLTITFSHISIGFKTTTGKYQASQINTGLPLSFNLTTYKHIHGLLGSGNVESNKNISSRTGNKNVTELNVEVSANTITTSASTIDYRVNGGGNTLQVSYNAGVTGTKSVIGGTRVVDGDLINYRIVTPNTSGNLTLQQISSLYEPLPSFSKLNLFNFDDIDEGEEIG